MPSEIVNKGIELAKDAIKHDNEKEYETARQLYQQAAEHLLAGIKYERGNPRLQEMLKAKCDQYLSRAETLKTTLEKPAKKPVAQGGQGSQSDAEEGDAEKAALRSQLSSAVVIEKPNVQWSDVAGLEGAKEALQEAVILPMRLPHFFKGKREPWRGILLYGPPGTGKSFLAKAVATEANKSTFISVSSSDLVSKWQGQSERLVAELFDMAREAKPCIIFIDEIDSLCSARSDTESESSRRIKTEFLVQMQGVGQDNDGILVLGATNIPWQLDSAIRRRFEKRIYIPLPDEEARRALFQLHLKGVPHTLQETDYSVLARSSEGYSGADIGIVVRDAIMEPVRRVQIATYFQPVVGRERLNEDGVMERPEGTFYQPCSETAPQAFKARWTELEPEQIQEEPVTLRDMQRALTHTKKTVNQDDLGRIEEFTKTFGQEA
eukprot:m.179638 g.179638  ORF g.179638 m.179638 type:complete len:436 (+) comp14643_c0_seq2:276-1583(+)